MGKKLPLSSTSTVLADRPLSQDDFAGRLPRCAVPIMFSSTRPSPATSACRIRRRDLATGLVQKLLKQAGLK
jgi:hypothetical protein